MRKILQNITSISFHANGGLQASSQL